MPTVWFGQEEYGALNVTSKTGRHFSQGDTGGLHGEVFFGIE